MLLLLLSLLFSTYSDLAINDLPTILCTISSELIELALQHLPKILLILILVLMPSLLLFFPSMTSICCLLKIYQHCPLPPTTCMYCCVADHDTKYYPTLLGRSHKNETRTTKMSSGSLQNPWMMGATSI